MKDPAQAGSAGMIYVRHDHARARLVYRAQVVLRVLGPGAAQAFMACMRLERSIIRRVLAAPPGKLRR